MSERSTAAMPFEESSVAIVGVGLIGGSIAAALKARGFSGTIVGAGRSEERLEAARDAGLLDEITTLAPKASLVVYCTPVNRIARQIESHAPFFDDGTVVTDAGSVKGIILDGLGRLPEGVRYVGAHPLAGSEKAGFEHADPHLFVDRTCVVTPTGDHHDEALKRVSRFWAHLGSRVVTMEADDHDRILAMTSHVPHVVAAMLASTLASAERPFAATGFRDTTRIAAGDPAIWVPILLANREAVLEGLERNQRRLERFQRAIERSNGVEIERLLAEGKLIRESLDPPATDAEDEPGG